MRDSDTLTIKHHQIDLDQSRIDIFIIVVLSHISVYPFMQRFS